MKEQLLQYVWKHRLFPTPPLFTTSGERLEVLDPGLWNHDAGPDFFNAKVVIGGQTWVGNVEVHLKASDWLRHGHQADKAYDNVVLHVVGEADAEVTLPSGRTLPQFILAAPQEVVKSFDHLMAQEAYPPCFQVIPHITPVKVHAWLNALSVERLEQKTRRIDQWLHQTGGDWERTFFIALSRAMGFGVNSEAFEQWAVAIDLTKVGKHRDQKEQVEAFFLGMSGLLDLFPLERISGWTDKERALLWIREWQFLRNKFCLTPLNGTQWKYLRMRPQNFPHVRLLQLARLFHEGHLSLAAFLSASDATGIRSLFHEALPHLQTTSLNLLLVNAAAPMLFAHGRSHGNDSRMELAFTLLESLPAESNRITRSWRQASLAVDSAADSQALIQLRTCYCDHRDCLRCRFGAEYLSTSSSSTL